ncbi:MAG: hypothetical protein K6T86_15120 [Pirellulales bacterium]|nr:hypothetical protein [Pirellulales bacterium]
MPIEKKPNPLPSPLDYVPPNSVPYRVGSNDSWYTLAELPQVKAAGLSANDLCHFNFKTRKPSEINWYLHHKVGCRKATKDGKNYVFSTGDTPGIVYLPAVGAPLPVNEFPPARDTALNAWFGLVGKLGEMVGPVGIESIAGFAASLDHPGKGLGLTGSVNRLGGGLGVSGGAAFVFITGVNDPGQLNGHMQGDWDFNLSLGPNWGKVAKAAVKAKQLKPLVKLLNEMGAKTPSGLKKVLKAHPDKWAELVKQGKALKEAIGIDPNGEPNVFIFDIPFAGGGTEASVFYGVSTFYAVWENVE